MAFEAKASSGSKPKWVKYVNPVNWIKGIVKFFIKCGRYINDSFREMKRITWPDKTKIIRSTVIVVVSVVIITGFTWAVDSIFNMALGGFLKILK